jgi:hypothetical protein
MKKKTMCVRLGFAAAVLVLAGSMLGAEKPNFSGTWVVNPERSRLADWAKFDSTTITIEHKEPALRFHRLSIKSGKTDESAYALTTDGVEKVEKTGGRTSTSRLTWDGNSLVLQDVIVLANGRQATNTVRYTLKDAGKTLVAEESFRGPVVKYDNLWVADRKN